MTHSTRKAGYDLQDTRYNLLTPSQRQAVFHFEGPLLVLAGPGSGKTRVITHRIAALIDAGIKPGNICAITFTNKAADEMRQRAFALGASAGAHISTFHSLCVTILRRYAAKAGISSNFSVYDASDQAGCIKQAVKDCELDTANFSPARMLDAVSSLKNKLIDVDYFREEADGFFTERLAKIYARYQHILAERDALDFDDLLFETASLLQSCPDVCSQLGNRFKFLLIDEYQDTNHAQYKIAKALVSSHNNICATGDPDQSIYRWRGADIRNILAFESDWPDAAVVKLEENFRSTPNILEIADRLISFNQNRKQKKLIPTRPGDRDVIVNAFSDEIEEAQGIVHQLKELIDEGVSPNDIAVFYRVNSMSRVLEEAFIRNKITYQIVRGVEFYNRKEIRDILAYLKILVNPSDEIALLRIINTPARGIGKTTIDKIRSYAALHNITFFDALKTAGNIDSLSKGTKAKIACFVNMMEQFKKLATENTEATEKSIINNQLSIDRVAPLVERIFNESGLKNSLQGTDIKDQSTAENVNELINAAAQYDNDAENPSLLDYLQQISLFSDVDSFDTTAERRPVDCGRVALMTLHAAKGLEFENVFIIGLEEGLLPHERGADDQAETEEERRLFFVGVTRAETGLFISYVRYRTLRGQLLRTIPSRFLYELGIDFAEPTCVIPAPPNVIPAQAGIHCSASHLTPGQLVRHKSFGLGRVKEFNDVGERSTVVVRFNTGQTKTLMVKYANLSKI